MTEAQIKGVIIKKCLDLWGSKAVLTRDWDLEKIAAALAENCRKYQVDPRLALAQGIAECHFAVAPGANRSRKTRNIYNVGNVDSGGNRYLQSYEQGIETYCRLIAREYNWEGGAVTAESLIAHDFRRPRGGRYATDPAYTATIAALVKAIDKALRAKKQTTEDAESSSAETTKKNQA